MSIARISVIIVTATGSREHVERCLRALAVSAPRSAVLEVTVVDNASDDDVVAHLGAHFPAVTVHALGDNRGFAAGVNHGIRRTSGDFVLLLNPDAAIEAEAIERMLALIEGDLAIAAVGPRLVDGSGRSDHNAKRAYPTPVAALAHFGGAVLPPLRRRAGYGRADIADSAVADVDALSGSCMLVRRAAIDDAGLLDEGYWMYGEDLDWCRRLRLRGWRIVYAGDAVVLHLKHGVSGRRRPLRLNWAFHRAMGRFYRRFDAGRHPALDALVYAGVLVRFLSSALSGALWQQLSTLHLPRSRRALNPRRTASARRTPARPVTSTTDVPAAVRPSPETTG